MHIVLEKCIQNFKADKSVHSDQRYLEVWLKYAAISDRPVEVYDYMYKNGLCTQLSGLYEAWAWHLESSGSFKKAEGVFVKGLGAMVEQESKGRLAAKQKQFQARVLRRMRGEEIADEEVEEETRSALGKLKPHGSKARVGSVRVGRAKLGGPGVMQVNKLPLKDSNGQEGGGFAIFHDENAEVRERLPGGGGGGGSLPSSKDRKENEIAPGKWNKAKVKSIR